MNQPFPQGAAMGFPGQPGATQQLFQQPQQPQQFQQPAAGPVPVPGVSPLTPVHSVTTAQGKPQKSEQPAITVGPFILSYPHLFVPRMRKNPKPTDKPSYSAELLVWMDSPNAAKIWSDLWNAVNDCAVAHTGKVPQHWVRWPVKLLHDQSKGGRENYSGPSGIFINANTVNAPAVAVALPDRTSRPATSEDMYPGAIVYVTIRPSFYKQEGTIGVKWYLNAVMKVADGERLTTAHNGEADINAMLADQSIQIAPTQQPQMPGMQPQQFQQPQMPGMQPQQFQQPQMPGMQPQQFQQPPGIQQLPY